MTALKTKPLSVPYSSFLSVLRGQKADSIPAWFMRQAGRYLPEYREIRSHYKQFLDLCFSPEDASKITLQPIQRFDLDAAILFSDILVIPHALGQTVTFAEGEGPRLNPITDAAGIKALSLDNVDSTLAPIMETVRLTRANLSADKALIGFAGAPWTVACYMVAGRGKNDFAEVRRFALENRALFSDLISILIDSTTNYLLAQVEAGADALMLFDSWAGLLPESEFHRWVSQPTEMIALRIRAQYPDIPLIGFPRGAGSKLPAYVEATGVDALGLDVFVSASWAEKNLPPTLPLQGNLDPLILAYDLDRALREAENIMYSFADRPFIFNTGHGLIPETPPEHLARLVELVRNWRR